MNELALYIVIQRRPLKRGERKRRAHRYVTIAMSEEDAIARVVKDDEDDRFANGAAYSAKRVGTPILLDVFTVNDP